MWHIGTVRAKWDGCCRITISDLSGEKCKCMHRHRFNPGHWSKSFWGKDIDVPKEKATASSLILLPPVFPEDIGYFPQGPIKNIRARVWSFLTPVKSHHWYHAPPQLSSVSSGEPGVHHYLTSPYWGLTMCQVLYFMKTKWKETCQSHAFRVSST